MPKVKESNAAKVKAIVNEFKDFTISPTEKLFCQHLATLKHKKGIEARTTRSSALQQAFIHPVQLNNFTSQLVRAFASSDIPLVKVQHLSIRKLFVDLGKTVPSESACRQKVFELSEADNQKLLDKLSEKELFFVMDETDLRGKKFLHTLCGTLDKPDSCFLVKCSVLDRSPNS
ncbi:unnamed protein product [Clavelina lepadiformis]|uniref:Uncharacterized protein n=1 Tax=Clavelina lepadiformis TaxID=159417 RepID=A0ABP0FES2_CLALP